MQLNEKVPAFSLKGTDGKIHSLSDYSDKKVLVMIITCNHCPYAQAYINRISKWTDRYRNSDVALLAVNGNDAERYPMDDFDGMVKMDERLGLKGWYLHDENQDLLTALRAERTPEVFVFDEDQKLQYKGALDDNYEDATNVEKEYLIDAIEALRNGEKPKVAETPAVGCSIKWKPVKL